MKSERVTFPGARGHELAARFDRPDRPPAACALFAHCFTCTKDLKATVRISRALVERGVAVLRFDFTGLGESGGDFSDTNFSSNLDDLVAAVEYLRRRGSAPKLLIGHSLGGAAVLAAAARVPEAVAVATIGAPSDTKHLRDTLLRAAPELEGSEEAEVRLAGRPFRIRRQLLDDLAEERLLDAVRGLDRALLVLHSPVDEVVGIEHARRIFQAASHPRSFISLDDADHLLLRDPADARYVAEVLAAWAGRYLDAALRPGEETPSWAAAAPGEPAGAPLPQGEVLVTGGATGYRQDVYAGNHAFLADEPVGVGGEDAGPTPYDFLLAALGTCTNMTLRMYAERKKWPLEAVETRLTHARVHAKDCADCVSKDGKIGVIERRIVLTGELDDAQRARLMEIADRCPVHRTLSSEIKIRTRAG